MSFMIDIWDALRSSPKDVVADLHRKLTYKEIYSRAKERADDPQDSSRFLMKQIADEAKSRDSVIKNMKNIYYVEGYAGWFLVKTKTKRDARHVGVEEFGRGHVKDVRAATPEDIEYFINVKGEIDEI